MIVVGGVTLDNDMVWEDEYGQAAQKYDVSRALDGTEIIQVSEKPSGIPITLSGGDDFGWQSRATVIALKALEVSNADATFTLQIYGNSYTVRFAQESPPAIAFAPVKLFQPETDAFEFWYTGTVKLMTA